MALEDRLTEYDQNYLKNLRFVLDNLFRDSETKIKNKINELFSELLNGYPISAKYFQKRLDEIGILYQEIMEKFDGYIRDNAITDLSAAYNSGTDFAYSAISKEIPAVAISTIDNKALQVMVKDIIHDFTVAGDVMRSLIGSCYKLSKQGIFTKSK